jgi:hypothetical protein
MVGMNPEMEVFSLEQVASLMAALPALTKLGVFVTDGPMPRDPRGAAADGFSRLRSLSLRLEDRADPDQVEAIAARLAGLEYLEVHGCVRLCAEFFSSLPPMPRLTELTARAHEAVEDVEVVCAPGRFLASRGSGASI